MENCRPRLFNNRECVMRSNVSKSLAFDFPDAKFTMKTSDEISQERVCWTWKRITLLLICLLLSTLTCSPQSTPQVESVTVPKLFAKPKLNGQCDDRVYESAAIVILKNPAGAGEVEGRVFHSTLDAYFCFKGLTLNDELGITALNILIDSDGSGGDKPGPGDHWFSIDESGTLRTSQATTQGEFIPIKVPTRDFEAVVRRNQGRLSVEARISLEWLGGYARTDRLAFFQSTQTKMVVSGWPLNTKLNVPSSWGVVTLGPSYPESVSAGSVFLDGRNGYLVVPYAPEINPKEITIEAWVKIAAREQGTLIGNGRSSSYWVGIVPELQFAVSGEAYAGRGQTTLTPGWHHVAASMNRAGIRTIYLDGEVESRPGFEPAREEEELEKSGPAKLGLSDRMLRIGSDRDALADQDKLHGWVRELRIWNRERSAEEIRTDAFRLLTGKETGLVGLWPFTNSLRDLVSGRQAGLVGQASLAREELDVNAFISPSKATPFTFPAEPPPSPWDAQIPSVAAEVVLDGISRPAEYWSLHNLGDATAFKKRANQGRAFRHSF
jgi:hypothetical protein